MTALTLEQIKDHSKRHNVALDDIPHLLKHYEFSHWRDTTSEGPIWRHDRYHELTFSYGLHRTDKHADPKAVKELAEVIEKSLLLDREFNRAGTETKTLESEKLLEGQAAIQQGRQVTVYCRDFPEFYVRFDRNGGDVEEQIAAQAKVLQRQSAQVVYPIMDLQKKYGVTLERVPEGIRFSQPDMNIDYTWEKKGEVYLNDLAESVAIIHHEANEITRERHAHLLNLEALKFHVSYLRNDKENSGSYVIDYFPGDTALVVPAQGSEWVPSGECMPKIIALEKAQEAAVKARPVEPPVRKFAEVRPKMPRHYYETLGGLIVLYRKERGMMEQDLATATRAVVEKAQRKGDDWSSVLAVMPEENVDQIDFKLIGRMQAGEVVPSEGLMLTMMKAFEERGKKFALLPDEEQRFRDARESAAATLHTAKIQR